MLQPAEAPYTFGPFGFRGPKGQSINSKSMNLDLMQAQFDMHVLKAAAFSSSHSQAQAKILSLYMSQPLSCRQDTRKSLLIRGVFHLHWRHFSMACKM